MFLTDNGACPEQPTTTPNIAPGPVESYRTVSVGWANASNTPFQFFKKDNHEGGIASPLIAHWPDGIEDKDKLRHQPGHVIDIMATCLDVSGATYPKKFNDHVIKPLEGRSLVPTFTDEPLDREGIYWEHFGNRAVRSGDWKLVANTRFRKQEWELYNLKTDRTERVNLINQRADKAQELKLMWEAWAKRANVLPKPQKKPKKNKNKK